MFTRLSNFTYGNYRIANINSTEMNVDTQLLIQIQKYETECLQLLLPNGVYAELMNNVELKNDSLYWTLKDTAEDKWDWLINGQSYTGSCGNLVRWRGLLNKVATIQTKEVIESLMASYIFFQYSLNNRTLNTGVGESRMKADNVTQESSANKRVDAWNEFVKWSDFGFSETNVSLNQFLRNHTEQFECLELKSLNTMTYYDI